MKQWRSFSSNGTWLAFLLVSIVLAVTWHQVRIERLNVYDQPFYLGIAYDIRHGRGFTDGYVFSTSGSEQQRPPGMRFTPLYPGLLAAAASLDSGFAAALDCVAGSQGHDQTCPRTAPLMRGLQIGMVAGIYMLVWFLGGLVSGSRGAAWISLLLALFTAPVLLRYAAFLMTDISSSFWFLGATAVLAWAIRRRRGVRPYAAAGVLFGLAALTRPAFLFGGVATAAAGLGIALLSKDRRTLVRLAGAFGAGLVITVLPWVIRNALVVGHLGLTHGYDSHTLAQRISFDLMSWHEYGLSYLCWLPDWLKLSGRLFGADACARFGWEERPDTFYMIGNNAFMQDTLAAAGGWEHHLAYLVDAYLLTMPIKHLLVTLSLALRGAWVGGIWGFVLMPVCVVMTIKALRADRRDVLAIALPAWFMLLFNALVAVNQTRYNLILIPMFAVAGGCLVESFLATRRRAQDVARPAGGLSSTPTPSSRPG